MEPTSSASDQLSRLIMTVAVMAATAAAAHAEVWMVKGANTLACDDRQTLIDLDALPPPTPQGAAPQGCIVLYSGERLLEQPGLAQGFTKYLKVERDNGAILFVRNSDVVSDPGIGDPSDGRR